MYPKNEILDWINDEKSQIVSFLQDFIRAKSPNPPGDTVNASKVIRSLLKKHNANPHKGYSYGNAWLYKPIPTGDIAFIKSMQQKMSN